jgi:hypothetical protein
MFWENPFALAVIYADNRRITVIFMIVLIFFKKDFLLKLFPFGENKVKILRRFDTIVLFCGVS